MDEVVAMRPVILKTLVLCLALAMAPWFSGGQEPVSMLISGFALLLGALLVWRQPAARVLRRGPLVVSFALLIGLGLLSLLWTASRYSSSVWVVQWVLMGLAFRLSYAIAGDLRARKWIVNTYLVSAAVFCLVAIWMYLTSRYGRLTGTFYWANPAASYLLPALIISLDRLRQAKGRAIYGWMGALILFGASFLLTDSRATTLVLFIIVGLYLLLVKLSKRFWIHFVFICVAAFGLSVGLVELSTFTVQHSNKVAPGSRLGEAVKGESSSGSDRIYYLGSAFDMWFSHPVGGVGAGAYGDIHPEYQQRVVSASTSAHNEYVQILAELGLAGVVLLATVLLSLGLGSLRGLIKRPELVPVAIGVLGVLMHMGLDIDARYPALLCLVGGFLGLIYAQREDKWVKTRLTWPIVAAVILVPIISLYFSETWAGRARDAQADQDYPLATEDFAKAATGVLFNPDHLTGEGINRLQLAFTRVKLPGDGPELDEALKVARQAEKLDPHDAQHHQLEGRLLTQKGDLKGAEAAFRRALALDRLNHPDYALDLANVLVAESRPQEAVGVAQAMLRLYPATVVSNRSADETIAPTLANLEALVGNAALNEGDMAGAKTAADRALGLDPKNLRGRALKHQLEKNLSVTPGP